MNEFDEDKLQARRSAAEAVARRALTGEQNPFIRYRRHLDSYRRAISGGLSDEWFVETVGSLDDAVASVDGHGFSITPVVDGAAVVRAADLSSELTLTIKDETGNVSGSHKSRHLFGVALHLLIDEQLETNVPAGDRERRPLAIASCGNAAMAAGVVAAALKRELQVFVPTWADEPVVDRLRDLGATVEQCVRQSDEAGDPAYLRYREAAEAGAQPFTVQGTDTPTTFDGGRTLGWELAEQAASIDSIYFQVGGGALATAVSMALPDAALHPVQAEGCAPLRRAWDRLAPGFDFDRAATHPQEYMWPWEDEPTSAASGILDDVTYDWLPLLRRTRASGGVPLVVPEATIVEAHQLARAHTAIPTSATGTAGLAGLIHHRPLGGHVAVAFTGIER